MTAPIVELDAVRLRYGSMEVLKGVSLSVQPGETFAIIGPNGAGKTTLFRAMTGEARCSAGRVLFNGRDVTHLPVHQRTRLGFGRTFQVARVFQELTALTNVIAAVESRHRAEGLSLGPWWAWRPAPAIRDEAESLLADLGLQARCHTEARFLSHGDKKRLELAVVLALRPAVLMLDEPTAGMAHADRLGIVELIRRLRADHHMTVVMTEHDMDVIFGLADRLMVLNYGEIIATGTVEAVRANPLVREVYLGREMVHA